MSVRNTAVIGLGFGDEGKGSVVHHLAKHLASRHYHPDDMLVVRYSGGHQAGHTVRPDKDTVHIFSNFGSASFVGVPTYWSKYCTFAPPAVVRERQVLQEKGVTPTLYVDLDCPLTTPYEVDANRNDETTCGHGSCGVGVGATWQREADHCSFRVRDLFFHSARQIKYQQLADYYKKKVDLKHFDAACDEVMGTFSFSECTPKAAYNIFEGSQGLLLDQDHGFFPHVTRSSTGTKNILDMGFFPKDIVLVTRAYQTRHGHGPMTNLDKNFQIEANIWETNKTHPYQGQFRRSMLDLDLYNYAIHRDPFIWQNFKNVYLAMTCLDGLTEYSYTAHQKIFTCSDADDYMEKVAAEIGIFGDVIHSSVPWEMHNISEVY